MKVLSSFTQYYYDNNTAYSKNEKLVAPVFKSGSKIVASMIRGQENCWKLHDPKVFEQFVRADKELVALADSALKTCGLYLIPPSINFFIKYMKVEDGLKDFFSLVKSKYDIDLEKSPTVYRFIGKSELEELQSGRKVQPIRNNARGFDVTVNPELNWNEFRVTFKPKPEFSVLDSTSLMRENPGVGHEYFYYLNEAYSMDDVASIEGVSR